MKTLAAALLIGFLGVIAGSLAAQPPEGVRIGAAARGIVYEGPVELLIQGRDIGDVIQGDARIYDGWVVFEEQRRIIPREQVQQITLGEAAPLGEFGDQPAGDRNDLPVRPSRPFRED